MHDPKALGEFLRARREQLRPEDVGLAWSGRRRVPGLRREEVAMLAGVSPDYYLRLEQGGDIRPSVQVLDALARALQLDEDAAAHLHALSSSRPKPLRAGGPERVPAHVERLIFTWSHTPAVVTDQCMDVLAYNALMAAIHPVLRPGSNLIRAMFLDESARQRLENWEQVASWTVARLRAMAGADIDSPPMVALVDELSARSPEFGRRDQSAPERRIGHSGRVARMTIAGSRVLLTGASGGLGGAIARALDDCDAELLLTGRRVCALESLAGELKRAHVVRCDLADRKELDDLLARAEDGHPCRERGVARSGSSR